MNRQNTIRSILAAELILSIPLLTMLFTEEVDWKFGDFIIAGIILAMAGVAYRMIADGVKDNSRQVAIGIVLVASMILIWMELAVGIFGSPFAGS